MRNRNRNFRRLFGIGRRQLAMLQCVGQFGRPRHAFGQVPNKFCNLRWIV